LKKIVNCLKKIILFGPQRRWWIKKRACQLDDAYLHAIADLSSKAVSPVTPQGPAKSSISSLRRILYIGDCMWEQDQLFPEILKICDLHVLDLKSALHASTDLKSAVVKTIKNYAKNCGVLKPDLIIFYARPSLLSEEAFDVIRKYWSCPLFGMNLDDRVEFFPYGIFRSNNDNYVRWSKFFDLNLTSSRTALDWYRAYGAEAYYLPQGFCPDPRFVKPPDQADFTYPFSFVGSWKPERGDLIEQLKEYGITPTFFGRGWKNSQWANDPQVIFRNSQINLGIGYALASARIANAKGRDIECPSVGACYLTTYHWELAEMFEIGKEVLCYRNAEELIEMYTFYKRRPEACLTIAQAAHRRAHAEHAWESRLRKLFKDLGFAPEHCE
jgi:hypothetical protein